MKSAQIVRFLKKLTEQYNYKQFPEVIFINDDYISIGDHRTEISKELFDDFLYKMSSGLLYRVGDFREISFGKNSIVYRTIKKIEDGEVIKSYRFDKEDRYGEEKFSDIYYKVNFKNFYELILFIYEDMLRFKEIGFERLFSSRVRIFYSYKIDELYIKFHKSDYGTIDLHDILSNLREKFDEALTNKLINFYYNKGNYSNLIVVGKDNDIIKYTYDCRLFSVNRSLYGMWTGGK